MRGRNSCVQCVYVVRCSNVTIIRNISSNISTKLTIYKPKLPSRCNKNASTAFLNLKFSRVRYFLRWDPPKPPYEREKLPSRALPVSCLRHSGKAFGVPWPDQFSNAGDSPELGLTVKSRQKRQWSGADTIEFHIPPQTPNGGQAQPRRHLK